MTKPFRRKVRQSQTLTPFGVGGLLDLRGESFVASDVRSWAQYGAAVEARRLAAVLGVEGFRSAPVMPDGKAKWVSTVGPGYARFPQWLFCPQCRRMSRWSVHFEQKDKVPTCARPGCPAGTQLAPIRFVQICAAGHMGDVDWFRWAHSGHINDAQRQCAIRNELNFEVEQHSTGLDSLAVRCARCKASRSLIGIIAKDALRSVGLGCTGRQPWQPTMEKVDCREIPQAVQRGASNVYYPSIYSAIDIPSAVGNVHDDAAAERIIDSKYWTVLRDAPSGPLADALKSTIAGEAGTSVGAVDKLLKHTIAETANSTSRPLTAGDISQDEWTAFVNAPAELTDSGTFATEETSFDSASDTDATRALSAQFARVVLVHRLREVRALSGFSRLKPSTGEGFIAVNPVKTPRWLPAVECYGEGIFIAFDEARLQEWERDPAVIRHVSGIDLDLNSSYQRDQLRRRTGDVLTPRYVLIHTFAHLLIRQLAFDSGYNTASLRERVYGRFNPDSTAPRQAGVLIYTAAGDAEGTLGGLVNLGRAPYLSESVLRLLESASWCSNDPLCAEHTGQGFANLNRAACHACALIPETSCETGNRLLDRTVVIGNGDVAGYFAAAIESAIGEAVAEIER
jgi:hypothetical protein